MSDNNDETLELYVGENDPRVPYLGMQMVDTPNGAVYAKQVNGLTIDVYEVAGVQVGGVCLYSPDTRLGFVTPVHADGLRILAQAFLNAADHLDMHTPRSTQ